MTQIKTYGGFKEGDLVILPADEDQPEQKGKIIEVEPNGMFVVELDREFWDEDDTDGCREVYFTGMKIAS